VVGTLINDNYDMLHSALREIIFCVADVESNNDADQLMDENDVAFSEEVLGYNKMFENEFENYQNSNNDSNQEITESEQNLFNTIERGIDVGRGEKRPLGNITNLLLAKISIPSPTHTLNQTESDDDSPTIASYEFSSASSDTTPGTSSLSSLTNQRRKRKSLADTKAVPKKRGRNQAAKTKKLSKKKQESAKQ
jgi:hypothetical protein